MDDKWSGIDTLVPSTLLVVWTVSVLYTLMWVGGGGGLVYCDFHLLQKICEHATTTQPTRGPHRVVTNKSKYFMSVKSARCKFLLLTSIGEHIFQWSSFYAEKKKIAKICITQKPLLVLCRHQAGVPGQLPHSDPDDWHQRWPPGCPACSGCWMTWPPRRNPLHSLHHQSNSTHDTWNSPLHENTYLVFRKKMSQCSLKSLQKSHSTVQNQVLRKSHLKLQ